MSIHITEFADKKIGEILEKSDRKGYLLRAGVSGGGCSGLSYVFDFVKNPDDNDKVFSFANISICVDKKSYLYLNGMTIDYEETLLSSGIKIINPNAKRPCGCGESFSL